MRIYPMLLNPSVLSLCHAANIYSTDIVSWGVNGEISTPIHLGSKDPVFNPFPVKVAHQTQVITRRDCMHWGFRMGRRKHLQKRAVLVMSGSRYNAHTDPLFKKLHLVKLSDLFTFNVYKLFYNNHYKTNHTIVTMADTYSYQGFVNFVTNDMIGHYIENCSISNCCICNHTHSE